MQLVIIITIFSDVNGNKYCNYILPKEELNNESKKSLTVPSTQATKQSDGILTINKIFFGESKIIVKIKFTDGRKFLTCTKKFSFLFVSIKNSSVVWKLPKTRHESPLAVGMKRWR